MVYRLTPKSQIFFPSATNATTIEILQAANRLYGHAAGEKLLYSVFASKTENYMRKLRGKTVLELAEMLVKIRDQEGYMSELSSGDPVAIVEYHSPIFDLLEAFPLVRRLEREMMERILGSAGRTRGGDGFGLVPVQVCLSASDNRIADKRSQRIWRNPIFCVSRAPGD